MSNLSNLPSNKDLFFLHLRSLNLSKKTYRNYKSDFNHFLQWLKTNDIYSFNTQDIKNYLSYLRSQNTPIQTINRRLTTLRHYAKFLQKNKIVDYDLTQNIQNIGLRTNSFPGTKQTTPILITAAISILLIVQVIITDQPTSPWDPVLANSPDHQLSKNVEITNQPSFENTEEITVYLRDEVTGKPIKLNNADKKILLNSDPELKKSGKAIMFKNQDSAIVYTQAAKKDSLIHLTPTSSTNNQILYIDTQADGYFIVKTDWPVKSDVSFNWWITSNY